MRAVRTFRDQWGNTFHACTVRELREAVGGGAIAKMYRDKADGSTVHTGYVVGRHWCTEWAVVERAA